MNFLRSSWRNMEKDVASSIFAMRPQFQDFHRLATIFPKMVDEHPRKLLMTTKKLENLIQMSILIPLPLANYLKLVM